MTDKPIGEKGARSRAGWFDASNTHGFHPTDEELYTGWNEWLSVNRAVILQCPDDTKYQNNLRRLLTADCARGACGCRETHKRAGGVYMLCTDEDGQGFAHQTPERTEREYLVEASVFLSWLFRQGLSPSRHVTAWDVAINNPAHSPATSAPVVKAKGAKRSTPMAVALPYLREVYHAGKFSTVQVFIKALTSKSGLDGSPFKKASSTDDAFYLIENGKALTHGTLRNQMAKVRTKS